MSFYSRHFRRYHSRRSGLPDRHLCCRMPQRLSRLPQSGVVGHQPRALDEYGRDSGKSPCRQLCRRHLQWWRPDVPAGRIHPTGTCHQGAEPEKHLVLYGLYFRKTTAQPAPSPTAEDTSTYWVDAKFKKELRMRNSISGEGRNQRLIDVQTSLQKGETVIYHYNPKKGI